MRMAVRTSLLVVAVVAVCVVPTLAAQRAKVRVDRFPATMTPGEKGQVTVTVINVGDELWPRETVVAVVAVKDPNGVTPTDTPFTSRKTVGEVFPGYGQTMGGSQAMEIEAPPGRGRWTLEARVEIKGSVINDVDTFQIEVTSGYYGRFTAWKLPGPMKARTTYTFEFTVENTGQVWWDPSEVALNCTVKRALLGKTADAQKSFQKRFTAVKNTDLVFPGDDAKFVLKIESPAALGRWELEWQMYDLEEGELFGQKGVMTVEVTTLK